MILSVGYLMERLHPYGWVPRASSQDPDAKAMTKDSAQELADFLRQMGAPAEHVEMALKMAKKRFGVSKGPGIALQPSGGADAVTGGQRTSTGDVSTRYEIVPLRPHSPLLDEARTVFLLAPPSGVLDMAAADVQAAFNGQERVYGIRLLSPPMMSASIAEIAAPLAQAIEAVLGSSADGHRMFVVSCGHTNNIVLEMIELLQQSRPRLVLEGLILVQDPDHRGPSLIPDVLLSQQPRFTTPTVLRPFPSAIVTYDLTESPEAVRECIESQFDRAAPFLAPLPIFSIPAAGSLMPGLVAARDFLLGRRPGALASAAAPAPAVDFYSHAGIELDLVLPAFPSRTRHAVFCFPCESGSVCISTTDLLKDWSSVATWTVSVGGALHADLTLEDLVDRTAEAILATRPAGPYLLASTSLSGALLATRVAAALIQRGHAAALIFIDSGLAEEAAADELGAVDYRALALYRELLALMPRGTRLPPLAEFSATLRASDEPLLVLRDVLGSAHEDLEGVLLEAYRRASDLSRLLRGSARQLSAKPDAQRLRGAPAYVLLSRDEPAQLIARKTRERLRASGAGRVEVFVTDGAFGSLLLPATGRGPISAFIASSVERAAADFQNAGLV